MKSDARPLSVTILVQNLPVPLDRRVWCEASALRDAGYRVSVVAHRARGQRWHEVVDGIEVCRYPAPWKARGALGYALEFSWCFALSLLWCVRLAATRGIDVLHACNPPDTFFGIALLMRPFGVRFVYDQHDLCPELFRAKFGPGADRSLLLHALLWLERRTYAAAHIVISPNHSYACIARGRGELPSERVFVVRSAPPRDRFQITPPSKRWRRGRRHLVGYIGVMGVQDGIDHLLRAAHHIVRVRGRTDVGFLLIGSGDELESARELARQLGIADHVEFTGRMDDLAEITEALGSADVCVCPDPANPFNDLSSMNKIVEYMALAKPVVGYALTESLATVRDGASWARDATPEALAAEITALLDDAPRRLAMGRHNRERFLALLTWEAQVPELLAAYRTAVGPRPGTATQRVDTRPRTRSEHSAATSATRRSGS